MKLKFYNALKFEQERFPVSDCCLIYIVKDSLCFHICLRVKRLLDCNEDLPEKLVSFLRILQKWEQWFMGKF